MLGHNELERRPHVRLAEMARKRRAIPATEYDVHMDGRFSGRCERDISNKRGDLDLLANRYGQVFLLLPIEVFQLRIAQCTDAGDLRSGNSLSACEIFKTSHGLVTRFQNECISPLPDIFVQELASH